MTVSPGTALGVATVLLSYGVGTWLSRRWEAKHPEAVGDGPPALGIFVDMVQAFTFLLCALLAGFFDVFVDVAVGAASSLALVLLLTHANELNRRERG